MTSMQIDQLRALLLEATKLAGGWREAIVELEDWCSEPVRLKNMISAADSLEDWQKRAAKALMPAQTRKAKP